MRLPNQPAGVALLIFLIILVLGISALLLSTLNQTQQLLEEDAKTQQQVLAQAKEALIGYAVNFYDGSTGNYGFLPCPDVDESDPASWPEGPLMATVVVTNIKTNWDVYLGGRLEYLHYAMVQENVYGMPSRVCIKELLRPKPIC